MLAYKINDDIYNIKDFFNFHIMSKNKKKFHAI